MGSWIKGCHFSQHITSDTMPRTPARVATLLRCVCGVMCSVFVQGFYQNLCDYIHDKKWENRNLCVTACKVFCCVSKSFERWDWILFWLISFFNEILHKTLHNWNFVGNHHSCWLSRSKGGLPAEILLMSVGLIFEKVSKYLCGIFFSR